MPCPPDPINDDIPGCKHGYTHPCTLCDDERRINALRLRVERLEDALRLAAVGFDDLGTRTNSASDKEYARTHAGLARAAITRKD